MMVVVVVVAMGGETGCDCGTPGYCAAFWASISRSDGGVLEDPVIPDGAGSVESVGAARLACLAGQLPFDIREYQPKLAAFCVRFLVEQ